MAPQHAHHVRTWSSPGLLSVVGLAAVVSAGLAHGAEGMRIGGPVPQQVLDDWQARRKACATVHWKVHLRELIPPGFLNGSPGDNGQWGLLPKTELWRERQFEAWIDLAGRRMRLVSQGVLPQVNEHGETPMTPYHDLDLFDGGRHMTKRLDVRSNRWQPVVTSTLWTSEEPVVGLDGALLPCLWGVGFDLSEKSPANDFLRDLMQEVDPSDYKIHALRTMNRSTVLVLRAAGPSRSYKEIEVDLNRAGVIVARAHSRDGQVRRKLQVSWTPARAGWRPESWTDVRYRRDGTLLMSAEGTVLEWECGADISAVEFWSEPETGELYEDRATDEVFVKSPEGQQDVPWELFQIRREAHQNRLRWIVAIVLLTAAAWGGWSWRRRRSGI